MKKEGAIDRWWPTTQSLDLVDGSIEVVTEAVLAEYVRFLQGEPIEQVLRQVDTLDQAFALAPIFTNVPTVTLVLPTRSKWTVLWNNSLLCDGYDSLCWNLTRNHGLTTVHWSAHDKITTFQAGAMFNFRRLIAGTLIERHVYCAQEDKRWIFHQSGPPLDEEEVSGYGARLKRERLNEAVLLSLLERLGARPWSDSFYANPEKPVSVLKRTGPPSTITSRAREAVLQTA